MHGAEVKVWALFRPSGTCTKLRRTTLGFVMSVCLCATIRLSRDGLLWSLISEDFTNICHENSGFIKSGKNDGTLHEDLCTFLLITRLILLRMRNISEYYVRENHDTHFSGMFLWDNVKK